MKLVRQMVKEDRIDKVTTLNNRIMAKQMKQRLLKDRTIKAKVYHQYSLIQLKVLARMVINKKLIKQVRLWRGRKNSVNRRCQS